MWLPPMTASRAVQSTPNGGRDVKLTFGSHEASKNGNIAAHILFVAILTFETGWLKWHDELNLRIGGYIAILFLPRVT